MMMMMTLEIQFCHVFFSFFFCGWLVGCWLAGELEPGGDEPEFFCVLEERQLYRFSSLLLKKLR